MDVGWPSFLHLCIFDTCRCITTALFSVAVVSAKVMERSDSITSSHPMIPVLCLRLRVVTQDHQRNAHAINSIFSHCDLRCCQLAQSCLQFSNPPFGTARYVRSLHVTQTLNSSSSATLLLGTTSGSFLSLNFLWLASASAFSTNLVRPRARAVTSDLDLWGRSHSADSSPHLLEHLNLFLAAQSDELHLVCLQLALFLSFTGSWVPIPGWFLHGFLGPDPWLFYFLHGPFGRHQSMSSVT